MSEEKDLIQDRQIRLWGADVQTKLNSSIILFFGVGLTTAEMAKNMILAGCNIHIVDNNKISMEHTQSYFFPDDSVGEMAGQVLTSVVQPMNKYAKCTFTTHDAEQLTGMELKNMIEYATVVVWNFDVYQSNIMQLNDICRESGVAFVVIGTYGSAMFSMYDFGESYTFKLNTPSDEKGSEEKTLVTRHFSTIRQQVDLKKNALKSDQSTKQQQNLSERILFLTLCLLDFFHATSDVVGTKDHRDVNRWVAWLTGQLKRFEVSTDLAASLIETGRSLYGKIGRAQVSTQAVVAVLSASLCQELCKYISKKGKPRWNWLYFDHDCFSMEKPFGDIVEEDTIMTQECIDIDSDEETVVI
eukprot:Filipodium_phascolosomae@DN216_c0_g1_i1.p1